MMKKDRAIKWTNETLRLEALKYKTRTEFSKFSKAAYMAAWKKGILDEICSHMDTKPRKKKGFWNDFENLKVAAIECKEIHILRKHPAYSHILKHPRKDEILVFVTYRKEHITDDVFKERKLKIENQFYLKCLENVYSGVDSKYQFECLKCQYRWEAIWDNVYSGKSNCPKCAGLAKRTIQEIHKKAHQKGGGCHTKIYTNIKDLYKFSCVENHHFQLDGEAFLYRDSWCPVCYKNPLKGKYKNSIEDIRKLVEIKSGRLKSTIYQGMHKKYEVICGNGHPFKISGANLYSGKWCSSCWNPNENFCRTVLEQMLGIELPKKRPKWLYSLTGKRLELDGYCSKQQIAFEYNGIQHYEFVSTFHSKDKGIKEQQERDKNKANACDKHGVSLIVVPFFQESSSIDERLLYIENIVLGLDLDIIPSYYDLKKKNKLKFICPEIDKLKKKISDKGGVLKDNIYIDTMHPITVICSKGHKWVSRGEYINQGSWCRECYIESIRKY